jgi:hypothetical protein
VKEYKQYADRAYVLYKEDVAMKHMNVSQGAHIGKLIVYNLMWHIPANKNASKEANDWQEQLTRYKVEQVEDGHVEQLKVLPRSERQRADGSHQNTPDSNKHSRTFASGA